MFPIILGAIIEGAKKIFGSSLQTYVRLASRIALFAVFSSIVMMIIDYFLNKIRDYSFNGVDSCVVYFFNVIGFFPAIGIFLQIVAIGFLAKHFIHYLRESI